MQTRQPVVEIIHPMVVESLRKKTPAEQLKTGVRDVEFRHDGHAGIH